MGLPKNGNLYNSKDVALITGASSGLGREIAIEFARNNHGVVLNGTNEVELSNTVTSCLRVNESRAPVHMANGNLTKVASIGGIAIIADLYDAKYLILCAAAHHDGKFTDQLDESVYSDLTTNVHGQIKLIHDSMPTILRKSGTIVHINSVAGRNASPNEAVYSASKHAMAGFLKALRLEVRESGIRVLDVFLSATNTPMTAQRPDKEFLIDPTEVAKTVYQVATNPLLTAQIEELTIGRFKFPPAPKIVNTKVNACVILVSVDYDNLTKDELIAIIKDLQGQQSAAKYAETLDITPSMLSQIYKGTRDPGKTVLNNLGIQKRVTYVAPKRWR